MLLSHDKKNVRMTKMKCDCKVADACNSDVPQKVLSEYSQRYVIGGSLK